MKTLVTSLITTLVIACGVMPSNSWARQQIEPIRPFDSSSPFGFQMTVPTVPNGVDRRYMAVDTGGISTCAIRSEDRGIDCWGDNELGSASPGDLSQKYKSLSLGESVGCALNVKNELSCWGFDAPKFSAEDKKQRYTEVSTGYDHVCAIRANSKSVDCWVGSGRPLGVLTPPAGPFETISSGNGKTCGVRRNGEIQCWGDAGFVGIPVPSGKFTDVSLGTLHACAVQSGDGRVLCWGNGIYGEDVPPSDRFKSVTTGTDHTCGLRENDTVICWGRNEWGQLDFPGDIKVSSLKAGGAQTCALDKQSGHILCYGSFAGNHILFPYETSAADPVAKSGASARVAPVIAVAGNLAMSAVTGLVGTLFTKWGDSVDGVFGDALLFVGGLFGGNSDKETLTQLNAILTKLDELSRALDDVDKKSSAALGELSRLGCDAKLKDLDDASLNIKEAFRQYYGEGPVLTPGALFVRVKNEAEASKSPNYIPSGALQVDIRNFASKYRLLLESDMAAIDSVVMDKNYVKGILNECLANSLNVFRSEAGDKQLDDRRIWTGLYNIIQKTMADQAKGAQMLLDMNKFTAINSLTDGSIEAATPVIKEGSGWKAATICADTKAHSALFASNPRWRAANDACVRNEGVTISLYRNLVQQIEKAGAPYSNKQEVLVMGSDLTGVGTMPENFLWYRNPQLTPQSRLSNGDWGLNTIGPSLSSVGDTRIYQEEGNVGMKGTWRSDGQAWWVLFENSKGQPSYNEDRLTYMADTKSTFDGDPLINPSVKDKAFWMTGKTWNLDWGWVMAQSNGQAFENSAPMAGAKCFAGAGIKRVCNDQELGKVSMIKPIQHLNPGNYDLSPAQKFNKHFSVIGDYAVYFYKPYQGGLRYDSVSKTNGMWPSSLHPDVALNVIPVLEVKYRNCTSNKVIQNQTTNPRTGFRAVMASDAKQKEIPSRCGTDLDYFIDQLLKRPDVPGLDAFVRPTVYPPGVN